MRAQLRSLGLLELLLLVNVALQVLDATITLVGLRHGLVEGNPIVASLIHAIGAVPALVAVKCAALVALLALYRLGRHWLVAPGLASLALAYTLLAVLPWTLLLARHGLR